MKLSTDRGHPIDNPTPDDIRETLHRLPADSSGFAILEESQQYFIQAAGCPQDGFVLEYREGSNDRHLRATPIGTSFEDAVTAFQMYAQGDDSYKARLAWEPAFKSASKGCARAATMTLGAVALLAWLIVCAL